jgi:hypothetical protein
MLDVIFVFMFGILTIVTFAYPPSVEILKYFSGVILYSTFVIGISIMWFVFGRPFCQDYAADEVGIEALSHPVVMLYVRINTGMWLIVFIICILISLPSGIIQSNGVRDPQTAFIISMALSPIMFAFGFIFSYWLFPRYFYANMDKFTGPYEKEIDEWVLKHPDHIMSADDDADSEEGEDAEESA